MAQTYRDVVHNALRKLNIMDAEDVASAADAKYVLDTLNRIFDRWNGRGLAAYVTQFVTYTLTPSLNPHTFGTQYTAGFPIVTFTPSFSVAVRPEAMEVSLINGSSRVRLTPHDEHWWLTNSSRTMSGIPSEMFYNPSWPFGQLYLWPVPSGALQIEVASRQLFASGSLDTPFTLPPGFLDAVTLTLAEDIAEDFGTQAGPKLQELARSGRAQLEANHGKRYPIGSDYGLGPGAHWNYLTGRYK